LANGYCFAIARNLSSLARRRGYALVFVFGALSLLLIAFLGQLSMHTASRSLAFARMRKAVARADARFALNQALANLAQWPGMDACATAPGDIAAGSAEPRWTLCEKADGTRAYLVSTLPTDSHASADILLASAADSLPAVYAPKEAHYAAGGEAFAATAWWADDLGAKAPVASVDGRDDARLFTGLAASDAAAARVLLKQQMPGPYRGEDASYTARRSAFVLSNAYDGGLREDLSALAGTDAATYAHPPSAGEAAWMQSTVPIGGKLATDPGAARFEPVITEFMLACGLGANSDEYTVSPKVLNVVLAYHVYVEIWNPFTRKLEMGSASPDIRVRITGLPTVTGTTLTENPIITLPNPLVVDADCWNDLAPGAVQLLACPASGGGSNAQGAWQVNVGKLLTSKFNYMKVATLHFSSASPTIEFYDLHSSSTEPFYTLKLKNYAAFDMVYDGNNEFFRSAILTTSYGMGRVAINAGGWAFAYHMRLADGDLAALLRGYDPRGKTAELDASSGGDAFHYVLARPGGYVSSAALMDSDFFATKYRDYSYGDRQALFADPPASEIVSFAALRHAPTEGRAVFAVGAGSDAEADAELDRYFFSTLPSGAWNGSEPLKNFRLIAAQRGASVARSKDDAAGLLVKGGFNVNSTSASAWRAVLSTLALPDWTLTAPDATTDTLDLNVPLFSMPWAAAYPPTDAAAKSLIANDASAWENAANSLYKDRKHVSFLIGVREIGENAGALAKEIAARIKARAKPFHSLCEFAESGILQDAIDAVTAINSSADLTGVIQKGSPANVDQGELLCALSPMLFTHSDTFLLRVYGCDEKTGAKAWCEAVVQRLPEPVNRDAATYGRRLKVMSLRWLNSGDL
jgi:hypothetical protein